MSTESHASVDLVKAVALLGAAVVVVPIFRRLGLGSVLGYLAAGLLVGPWGVKLFTDPAAMLHIAELGVVMFLFVVGLEMRPSHLWKLRRQIFGLGTLQVGLCVLLLTGLLYTYGLHWKVAFIGAAGFVLTSTAIVMQLLEERGDIALPHGQKMVSVLLFEDLLIVPLLALVAVLAPAPAGGAEAHASTWLQLAMGVGALAALIAGGCWLLNPMFRLLAGAGAREVMTAAALLVVLGAAQLMVAGGLSMALGAFLAGVLLSQSSFRHQLEADIEPFRGLLLGLFFVAVGMSLDLGVVARDWPLIALAVLALMLLKGLAVYGAARLGKSAHHEALDRAVLMAQGGEFAFVLYNAAAGNGLFDATTAARLSAVVVLSMALTPLCVLALRKLVAPPAQSMEGIQHASGLSGNVLLIGFGRFGQIVSQALLMRGVQVSIIDTDIEMIRGAEEIGFKVYYGDGTRLDVLEASGAGQARAIAVCIDKREAISRIVAIAHHHFPQAKLLARTFDREHALQLVGSGVEFQIRETFESAMRFGVAALEALGVDPLEAADIGEAVRKRDADRFALEIVGGSYRAGIGLMLRNVEHGEGHADAAPAEAALTPIAPAAPAS